METIYRAQAIKRVVLSINERNAKRTDVQRPKPYRILDWIDDRYKEYSELCAYCGEVPITKGKWLLQKVESKTPAK